MDKKPIPTLTFSADFAQPAGSGPRRFSGVAYSGNVIKSHWAWGDVAFDLSQLRLPEKLPALVEHDRAKRAGVIDRFEITPDQGLVVSGYLLDNETAREVASDADAGFPWQMSVHIDPERVEEFPRGTIELNGRQMSGPLNVFRNGVIREVSFTPTGADAHTAATIFTHTEAAMADTSTTEGHAAELAALTKKITALEAENASLREQFAAKLRAERVSRFAAATGKPEADIDDETAEALAGMNDKQFALTVESAQRPESSALPEQLFSETATNGQGAPAATPLADFIKNRFAA